MLNILWTSFFVVSFIAAAVQSFFMDNPQIWTDLVNHLFKSATDAFQLALNLTGMLCSCSKLLPKKTIVIYL